MNWKNEAIERLNKYTAMKQAVENIPLEINLLGIRGQRHYPNPAFWKIAGAVKCPVVIGSDAHTPKKVTDPASEEIARDMVAKYNLFLLPKVPIHSYRQSPLVK